PLRLATAPIGRRPAKGNSPGFGPVPPELPRMSRRMGPGHASGNQLGHQSNPRDFRRRHYGANEKAGDDDQPGERSGASQPVQERVAATNAQWGRGHAPVSPPKRGRGPSHRRLPEPAGKRPRRTTRTSSGRG